MWMYVNLVFVYLLASYFKGSGDKQGERNREREREGERCGEEERNQTSIYWFAPGCFLQLG